MAKSSSSEIYPPKYRKILAMLKKKKIDPANQAKKEIFIVLNGKWLK